MLKSIPCTHFAPLVYNFYLESCDYGWELGNCQLGKKYKENVV